MKLTHIIHNYIFIIHIEFIRKTIGERHCNRKCHGDGSVQSVETAAVVRGSQVWWQWHCWRLELSQWNIASQCTRPEVNNLVQIYLVLAEQFLIRQEVVWAWYCLRTKTHQTAVARNIVVALNFSAQVPDCGFNTYYLADFNSVFFFATVY